MKRVAAILGVRGGEEEIRRSVVVGISIIDEGVSQPRRNPSLQRPQVCS